MTIDGKPVDSSHRTEVINPATEEAFATIAHGDAADVDRAVAAARRAFAAWSKTSGAERAGLCHALAGALEQNMPELMQLITRETGKPMKGLSGIGSGIEVGASIAWAHATAELDLSVEVLQDDDEALTELHYVPLGVVGSIVPWNWPLMIAVWHVIPALRVGNTVVMKPSGNAPAAVSRFAEIASEILPPGVLNLVHGGGKVGAAIATHPDVNKIIFTGSSETGRRIMQDAASSLKRLTLELGGNDAAIVLKDADVGAIAPKLFESSFGNSGQTCAAVKRVYVHEAIAQDLADALAEMARNTVVGNGLDEATQLGPLQNCEQLKVVENLANAAREDNGNFLCGGNRMDRPGYFFEPTVVTGLSNGSRLVDEEQFGPILPLIAFSDPDEAVRLANDSPNGLGGSVWSADSAAAKALAMRLECGSAWVNAHGAIRPDTPFGGIKQSGFGVEFGTHGLKEYASIHVVRTPK